MQWCILYVFIILFVIAAIVAWQFYNSPLNAIVSFFGCVVGIFFIMFLSRRKNYDPIRESLKIESLVNFYDLSRYHTYFIMQFKSVLYEKAINIKTIIIRDCADVISDPTSTNIDYKIMSKLCMFYYNHFNGVLTKNATQHKTSCDVLSALMEDRKIPDSPYSVVRKPYDESRLIDDLYLLTYTLDVLKKSNTDDFRQILYGVCYHYSKNYKKFLEKQKTQNLYTLYCYYIDQTIRYILYMLDNKLTKGLKDSMASYCNNFTLAYLPYVSDDFYVNLENYLNGVHEDQHINIFIGIFIKMMYLQDGTIEFIALPPISITHQACNELILYMGKLYILYKMKSIELKELKDKIKLIFKDKNSLMDNVLTLNLMTDVSYDDIDPSAPLTRSFDIFKVYNSVAQSQKPVESEYEVSLPPLEQKMTFTYDNNDDNQIYENADIFKNSSTVNANEVMSDTTYDSDNERYDEPIYATIQ
jgi:hypothetical protein